MDQESVQAKAYSKNDPSTPQARLPSRTDPFSINHPSMTTICDLARSSTLRLPGALRAKPNLPPKEGVSLARLFRSVDAHDGFCTGLICGLKCANCNQCAIEDTLQSYFLPAKPDFPEGGRKFECPNCGHKATYQQTDLKYKNFDPVDCWAAKCEAQLQITLFMR
jgi:hypothetical protein